MNARQIKALAEQAGLTFFLNEDLDAGCADDAEVLNRLEAALTPPMSPAVFEMAEEPEDVLKHVRDMRDYLVTLVTAFNRVGAYGAAEHAQKVAMTLNDFLNQRQLTRLVWPPEVVPGENEGEYGLRTIGGGITYGSEL